MSQRNKVTISISCDSSISFRMWGRCHGPFAFVNWRAYFGSSQVMCARPIKYDFWGCALWYTYVNRPFITSNWLCRTCIHELPWNMGEGWECAFFLATDSPFFPLRIALHREPATTKKSLTNKSGTWSKIEWEMVCYLANSLALQNNPCARKKLPTKSHSTEIEIANKHWQNKNDYPNARGLKICSRAHPPPAINAMLYEFENFNMF